MTRAAIFLLLSLAPLVSFAQPSTVKHVQFEPSDSTEELLDKYSEVHAAPNAYWQLTQEEWERYETLKENSPWAAWSNDASPLAILSYYATSFDEKRRYARIEAELDTWRQHSVTQFQTLYDKERTIVHTRYVEFIENRRPTMATLQPQDRLRLFVRAGRCDAQCRPIIARILASQAKTDIYVMGATTPEEIFEWAESASIPVERVKTKEITLNHEAGLLKHAAIEAGIPMPRVPSLFKRNAAGKNQSIPI